MMYRKAINELRSWKNQTDRKPLIVYGTRQVGKTWLIEEFGRTEFKQFVTANMDDRRLHSAFDRKTEPERILAILSIQLNIAIGPDTLLFIDEIQECSEALESLKYFAEKMPAFPVIAAGSLLGVTSAQSTSFPVGKTESLILCPMTFGEFLDACGKQALAAVLSDYDRDLMAALRPELTEALKIYLCVGGMPEAVKAYLTGGLLQSRKVQQRLLSDYRNDLGKHPPKNEYSRILTVWDSLPYQLAKESGSKFVYSALGKKGGAAIYLPSIEWLCRLGLVRMVKKISKPGVPLAAYADGKAFKLFTVDVGLLGAASGLEPRTITEGDTLFTDFKGSLTEQFVCQELSAAGFAPYYWSAEKSDSKIDFIVECNGKAVPIEVKAAENLRAKSLKAFRDRFGMELSVRTSLSGTKDEGWVLNIPLYAIGELRKAIGERTPEPR